LFESLFADQVIVLEPQILIMHLVVILCFICVLETQMLNKFVGTTEYIFSTMNKLSPLYLDLCTLQISIRS